MKQQHTNNLINESSPYLLQHAHNPVNWFAWSDEALHKAKQEDKPILVSIGYSACHWCHVMERESFEDESTAEIMNQYFINIKVDREERPDIDHIYMDAVQAITGTGGWPLNVFLTPDLKPFYGGTYFPPVRALNRSSWKEVLLAVANSYQEKKEAIAEQAESLMNYLINSNNVAVADNENLFQLSSLNIIAENLLKLADKEWGGFGQAPKFPQTFSILYLLRHYFFTKDANALAAAAISLDKMMMGGIYDHLGGGFCRYSTDRRWHVPHFEKMLYDNALLIEVFTEAYQLTEKEEYAIVINETIEFIKKEMTSSEGGFYSALDADSEGVEGKFYTWQKKESDELLKEDSSLFCTVFNISESGNWEHANILWQQEKLEAVAQQFGLSKKELQKKLNACKEILLQERQKRIRPGLDNKVLLSWNALMITGLCKAYAALSEDSFLELAKRNTCFIEENLFHEENGKLFHSWNKTTNTQTAFLDDYAALIKAYISLHQVTANNNYLLKAKFLTDKVVELFSDEANIFFYFTSKYQTDVIIRKIEMYDGATPSGNSLMAENLHVLSVFFDIPAWRQRAEQMLGSIQKLAEKYPVSFGVWNLNFQSLIKGLKEIVLMDEDYSLLLREVLKEYIPHKAIQASSEENNNWPMLHGKSIVPGETMIYICENYRCLKPVTTLEDFKSHLIKHF